MRRLVLAGLAVAVALGAAALVFGVTRLGREGAPIPTTRPARGTLDVRVHTRGELAARKSVGVSAPPIGGTMQIVQLAPSGSIVRQGDVIVRFDPAEQQFNLEQAKSEFAEAEQEIAKLGADSKVQAANDQVALLKARYAVRRAELEVGGNEFVGAIKAKQNLLSLEQARRQLAQLEEDARAHADTGEAARAVLAEKRQKAHLAMQFAERNISSLEVTAPIDGLVILEENRGAAGGFFFTGMSLPEFREGDPVQPGTTVADVVDVSTIELKAKVGETDRASLSGAASGIVRLEGVSGPALPATTTGVGGLASQSWWEVSTERQFEAAFSLTAPRVALRPGMTADVEVQAGQLAGVLHVPRQALFEKNGKTVVYVRDGAGFTARPVKVTRLTESRAVVEGLSPDVDIALADPDRTTMPAARPAAAPAAGGVR